MELLVAVIPVGFGLGRLVQVEASATALCDLVGAPFIERVIITMDMTAWVNDMSLLEGSAINERCTELRDKLHRWLGVAPPLAPICGTAVLCGFPTRRGPDRSLPEHWLNMLRDLGWLP